MLYTDGIIEAENMDKLLYRLDRLIEVISCSAFKLYVKEQSNFCGVGVPPALNIQFKCATA